MPAYNAATFIEESILSVLKQTYPNWELLIVDDGSIDNTADIAQKFCDIDVRIKYLFQENGKQGKARNFAIQQSKGEYIAFLDADDLWVAEKLERQVTVLRENSEISLIFSNGYVMIEDKIEAFPIVVKNIWTSDDIPFFIENNRVPILSVIVKKTAIIAVGGFSENSEIQNVEDYHLWMKLLFSGFKFMSVKEQLFIYRIHSSQSTYGGRHTTQPIIKMFIDLRRLWQTNKLYDILMCKRLKWFLFDPQIRDLTIPFLSSLLYSSSSIKTMMFKLISNFNIGNLKYRLLFKLCP